MPVVSLFQLDTSFPRIPGDIGSPETWRAGLDIHVVPELSVAQVINSDPGATDMTAVEAAMRSNISAFICGMMPGIDDVPVIENDFPAPV